MEDLTDGYRYRIGLIQNLTYDDADSRLSGLWEWLTIHVEVSYRSNNCQLKGL